MVASNPSRIWESPTNPASSPVNSLNHDHGRPAQLPSITTLTNDLPSRSNVPSSPSYPSTNRTSDPWGSQTQSTRKSWSCQSSPILHIPTTNFYFDPTRAIPLRQSHELTHFQAPLHIRPGSAMHPLRSLPLNVLPTLANSELLPILPTSARRLRLELNHPRASHHSRTR